MISSPRHWSCIKSVRSLNISKDLACSNWWCISPVANERHEHRTKQKQKCAYGTFHAILWLISVLLQLLQSQHLISVSESIVVKDAWVCVWDTPSGPSSCGVSFLLYNMNKKKMVRNIWSVVICWHLSSSDVFWWSFTVCLKKKSFMMLKNESFVSFLRSKSLESSQIQFQFTVQFEHAFSAEMILFCNV